MCFFLWLWTWSFLRSKVEKEQYFSALDYFSTMSAKDSVKAIFTCDLELKIEFHKRGNSIFAKKLGHRCLTGPRTRLCCIARKLKLFLNYFGMSPVILVINYFESQRPEKLSRNSTKCRKTKAHNFGKIIFIFKFLKLLKLKNRTKSFWSIINNLEVMLLSGLNLDVL